MCLGVACKVGKGLTDPIVDADVITGAVFAQIGIGGIVEGGLEHRAMDHRLRHPTQVGRAGVDHFHRIPNCVGMTVHTNLTKCDSRAK